MAEDDKSYDGNWLSVGMKGMTHSFDDENFVQDEWEEFNDNHRINESQELVHLEIPSEDQVTREYIDLGVPNVGRLICLA